MKRKFIAFTLAEVLIAMTIIGFLFATLVPVIKGDKLQKKLNLVKVKKIIADIDKATNSIKLYDEVHAPNNEIVEFDYDENKYFAHMQDPQEIYNAYSKWMRFEKDAGEEFCSLTECDDEMFEDEDAIYGGTLPSGAIVGFAPYDHNDNYVYNCKQNESDKCWGRVYIDANGKKGPNSYGDDIFRFDIGMYGVNQTNELDALEEEAN